MAGEKSYEDAHVIEQCWKPFQKQGLGAYASQQPRKWFLTEGFHVSIGMMDGHSRPPPHGNACMGALVRSCEHVCVPQPQSQPEVASVFVSSNSSREYWSAA